MYDFIVFENFYAAKNHLKDVGIIARMLQASGFTVAIADIYNDNYCYETNNIPILTFDIPIPLGNSVNRAFLSIANKYQTYKFRNNIDQFLKQILKAIKGQYKHLYVGSYFTYMTTGWLKEIPSSSCVFFWGLRSSRLVEHRLHPLNLNCIYSLKLRRYIDKNKNIKFFVSNEIIKSEFETMGFNNSRLVIRQERMINTLPNSFEEEHVSPTCTLLSIGSIRRNKRIELILEAIQKVDDENIHYVVAGKTDESYQKLLDTYSTLRNYTRKNYRLPEDEFQKLLDDCDFLILCDKEQESSVTNGTMNEALLKGKPIIAPDYNPYKYFIEKYGIGETFSPNDIDSLCNAIKRAKNNGRFFYSQNIKNYQKSLLFDEVVKQFKCEIEFSLNH